MYRLDQLGRMSNHIAQYHMNMSKNEGEYTGIATDEVAIGQLVTVTRGW